MTASTSASMLALNLKKWYDAAYNSLTVQTASADSATNKLKAKKWFSAHPFEGKHTSGKIFVSSVFVEFHTNDDKYVDVKATQSIQIAGQAVKVQYTPDYEPYYGVTSIIIEE